MSRRSPSRKNYARSGEEEGYPERDRKRRRDASRERYGSSEAHDGRRSTKGRGDERSGSPEERSRYSHDRRRRDERGSDDRRQRDRDDRERDYGGRRERDRGNEDSRRRRSEEGRSLRRSASPRASRNRSSAPESRSSSPVDKSKPNFGNSGLLAAATNTVKSADGSKSTVLKYNEPPEARKPILGWRLYVFKGDEQVELLHIHRQSAYLVGRDRLVADIAIDHPSCSKQHAAIQHRQVHVKDEYGSSKAVVKPFIIDLESTNGTSVNGKAIPTSRYYELQLNDVIKFGQSQREYVLLHDDMS